MITASNPITGKYYREDYRRDEKGYASYIAVKGDPEKVNRLKKDIHKNTSDIKDEGKNNYISFDEENSPRAEASPRQYIKGGLADKKDPDDFNQAELSRGTKVEMEHTSNPRIAREIATDHLTEDPHYYEKLAVMEQKPREKTWFEKQSPEYQARVKAEEHYYNTTSERYEKNRA